MEGTIREAKYNLARVYLDNGLRRSGAKDMTDAGFDEGTIMATAGWKTRSMIDRYCIRPLVAQQTGLCKVRQFRENERKRKGPSCHAKEDGHRVTVILS